jgi:hypothetical protein
MTIAFAWIASVLIIGATVPGDDPLLGATLDALVKDAKGEALDNLRAGGFLDHEGQTGSLTRQMRRVLDMDQLLLDLVAYRAERLQPRPEFIDLKTRQLVTLKELQDALDEMDRAAADAAKRRVWGRWIPLTRACLRLNESTPSVAALLPIEEHECQRAVALQAAVRRSLGTRYAEALAFRSSLTSELGDSGKSVAEARRAAVAYATALIGATASVDGRWSEKTNEVKAEFVQRWRAWMKAESRGDAATRPHLLGPEWTRLEPHRIEEGPRTRFPLRDTRLLIPWPFFLAEHLGLGEIWLRYEAPAFEWTSASTPSASEIVPRIRVRAEFRVRPGIRPEALGDGPIVACDRRLLGNRPRMVLYTPPPPPAGQLTTDAPVVAPGYPGDLEDLVKNVSPNLPADASIWFRALNSGFRARPAVEYLVNAYWKDGRLNDEWEAVLTPSEFPLKAFDYLAASGIPPAVVAPLVYPFDDSTADLAAIMALIRSSASVVLADLAVEGATAELKFREEAARRAFTAAGADAFTVRPSTDLMAEHAARRTTANLAAVTAMLPLPLPVAGVVVHPWPEADRAFEPLDWRAETVWLVDAREALESRFDRLASDSPRGDLARQSAALIHELERLSAASEPPDSLRSEGLSPWAFSAPAPGPYALEATSVDGESTRRSDLATFVYALRTLDDSERDLGDLWQEILHWRETALEIAWTSNVVNFMQDVDITLIRRAALPATPTPPAAPPNPNLPARDGSLDKLNQDQQTGVFGLMNTVPTRLARDLERVRSNLSRAKERIDELLKRYPSPSREDAIARGIYKRLLHEDEVVTNLLRSLQDASVQDLFAPAKNQKGLREAARKLGPIVSVSLGRVRLTDQWTATRKQAPLVSIPGVPTDRIKRSAARWLASRRLPSEDKIPADRVAEFFRARAKLWENHYNLGNKLTADSPDDYAISRDDLSLSAP